ncbi:hypothetical protein ACLK1T_23520 [Escherichia coli]
MAGRMPVPPLRDPVADLVGSITGRFLGTEEALAHDFRWYGADVFRCATDHFCRVLPLLLAYSLTYYADHCAD